ncbi:hypothetical protein [Rubinisphaera margarita]|uniref:hypothetical protein n=1 Tax=Rubinisphaera margarita TaxID=2909586 RepID=UPI001EE99E0A|nr:hypothetical protein [Rubinisphaera margarita]MCG6155089.1 hypothetical protein [Rubinisphaera margarita]
MSLGQTCERWARETEQSRDLQYCWACGLTWIIVGFVLLTARALGSFIPDTDAIRAAGSILGLSGLGLMSSTHLLRSRPLTPSARSQVLLLATITLGGILLSSLALTPLRSFWSVFLHAFVMAGVTVVLASRGLNLLGLETTSAVEATPKEVESTSVDTSPSVKEPAVHSGEIVQWLSRSRQTDGSETVEGMLRLELAAGQKQVSGHVVFTPSLGSVPEIECEPIGALEIEAAIGEVYPHGFRVDVRRTDRSTAALSLDIGFQALAATQEQNAA